jgi:chromosome segregation protein
LYGVTIALPAIFLGASEGAIDIPKIREIIKSIMEGGEKAFKLRLDKYGF